MTDPHATPTVDADAIAQRIAELRRHIPDTVRLVAVSKTYSAEHVRAAYAAGIRDFGENRVQEAAEKRAQLSDLDDITWHLIGQLQRNKARKALEIFHYIHSVDTLRLAQHLDRLAQAQGCTPKIFLQVKHRPDPNKAGWEPMELSSEIPQLCLCKKLQIEGLMTIPPFGLEEADTLKIFHENRILAEFIATASKAQTCINIPMKQLSMGMSADYLLAIQAGSTLVRLGQTIFGTRG